MTGMASLVEFQDFHLNLPHHPVVMMPTIPEMQTLEEIMAQDVEPLPTPPLSPDHVCASPSSESSNDVESTTDSMDITEALLNEMMQYEQLFADGVDDDTNVFGGSSNGQSCFSLEGNFLVQDCWWNSHTYQPRNTINIGTGGLYTPTSVPHDAINMGILGLYTPASTPPPQADEEQDQAEIDDETPTPKNDTSSESSSGDQTDCISPTDVFPVCLLTPKEEEEEEEEEEDTPKKTKQQPTRHTRQERTRRAMEREQRSGQRERRTTIMTRRSSANTSSNARLQPQASASSESEEEIDVVTVSDRPERTVTRGSSRRRSGSASAPCSRQGSPAPAFSRTKKRRHHVKRLRRLSSAGNEDITESDDEQRRASHNILERKRRNDLKYSFQLLREQVPELEENQRAPKVIILRKAAEYIREINVREERLEQEYEREKKREAQLLQRLAYLKTLPTAGLLGDTMN